MDLVKIGFIVKADGLKDANTQINSLLNKADKLSTKKVSLGFKTDNSFKAIQKSLDDLDNLRKRVSTTEMKLKTVGYSETLHQLEKLETLKKNLTRLNISVSANSPVITEIVNKLKGLKDKTITVKVVAPLKPILD